MELPRRDRGDELLRPGALVDLRARLRAAASGHDISAVIACAFDHRTRMLPFIFADTHMAPAGVRAVGSALADCGIEKVRIVLQQWNRRFAPSRMKLDGRVPDLFMVSSMTMHGQEAMRMIRDAHAIDEAHRPLIIAGGPRAVYEPHLFFDRDRPGASADVAVTGEEYVTLSLLEAILSVRARGESMRSAFGRARDTGALDDIPGLVYPVVDRRGQPVELIDTGIQRLVGDLDELPSPVPGYALLEAPSRRAELASKALPIERVRKVSPIASIVLTFGCKFACQYCPIPAYNQRQHRLKSGGRIAEEMDQLNRTYGLKYFFGADDNFFNDHDRTLEIVDTLAKHEPAGVRPLRNRVRWYSEVTVHDTLKMKDHLPTIRAAGCRGLWLGVEDMTATLVKKGQDANKTLRAFELLVEAGICPHPMMMHHDSQPLYTRGSNYGIVNQIAQLRRAGACSVQVLMLVPGLGSGLYNGTYQSGQAFKRVAGRDVEPWMHDGNYVIASHAKRPWAKQVNLWLAYLSFYNPYSLLMTLRHDKKVRDKSMGMQVVGMVGVTQNIRRTFTWMLRLATKKFDRATEPPGSDLPMRSCAGGPAGHAPLIVAPPRPTGEPPADQLVQVTVAVPGVAPSP